MTALPQTPFELGVAVYGIVAAPLNGLYEAIAPEVAKPPSERSMQSYRTADYCDNTGRWMYAVLSAGPNIPIEAISLKKQLELIAAHCAENSLAPDLQEAAARTIILIEAFLTANAKKYEDIPAVFYPLGDVMTAAIRRLQSDVHDAYKAQIKAATIKNVIDYSPEENGYVNISAKRLMDNVLEPHHRIMFWKWRGWHHDILTQIRTAESHIMHNVDGVKDISFESSLALAAHDLARVEPEFKRIMKVPMASRAELDPVYIALLDHVDRGIEKIYDFLKDHSPDVAAYLHVFMGPVGARHLPARAQRPNVRDSSATPENAL